MTAHSAQLTAAMNSLQIKPGFKPSSCNANTITTIVFQASVHFGPGKSPCTAFQGVNVYIGASVQTYAIYVPGKHPCGPKLRVMFKCPRVLTWDTMVYAQLILTTTIQKTWFRTRGYEAIRREINSYYSRCCGGITGILVIIVILRMVNLSHISHIYS